MYLHTDKMIQRKMNPRELKRINYNFIIHLILNGTAVSCIIVKSKSMSLTYILILFTGIRPLGKHSGRNREYRQTIVICDFFDIGNGVIDQ